MTLTRIAAAALLALSAGGAFAQAAAAPKSDWTLTGNAGLFSDYRFRGFSQTGYRPAFQGGFDLGHSSGFYVGNWNSNVEQGLYNGASLEMDFYGGYKRAFGDFGLDVGALYYYYPNSGSLGTTRIRNGELYVGGTWKFLSVKYYHAVTKFFSLGEATATTPDINTKNSWYLDVSATYDLGDGWGVQGHWGHQRIRNGPSLYAYGAIFTDTGSVDDYKLGVSKDFNGWVVGAAVVGTSKKDVFRTARSGFTDGAGKTSAVVSLSKSF